MVKFRSSPVWSMGKKNEQIIDIKNNTVGPGRYNVMKDYSNPYNKIPSSSISKEKREFSINKSNYKLGPGSYTLADIPIKFKGFSIGKSIRKGLELYLNIYFHEFFFILTKSKNDQPGPGNYNPKDQTEPKISWSVGKAQRTLETSHILLPSPDQYNPSYDNVKKSPKKYIIGKAERNFLNYKADNKTSPCSYNVINNIGGKMQSTVFGRDQRKSLDIGYSAYGGPGTHNPDYYNLSTMNRGRGLEWKQKIKPTNQYLNRSVDLSDPSPNYYRPNDVLLHRKAPNCSFGNILFIIKFIRL